MEITIKPTYKQHLAYLALDNPEIDAVFLGGGAGGGKSWAICESRLIRALRYPGYRSFIGRKELKRLMQSTFVTWQKVCQHHKIPPSQWKLNGQYNYIELANGSRIDLIDVDYNPSDPLYERFGSLEYTDGALEEAGEIHPLSYDVLKTRIGRHMNKELGVKAVMLITGNPKKNWTYSEFYKPWKDGTLSPRIAFIQSLFMDNPWTAEEYGNQLAQIKDKATKERLMNGNWEYDDDPTALMTFDAIQDLFTNSVEISNQMWLVCDVARLGNDKTTISIWEGLKCIKQVEMSKSTTDRTAAEIGSLIRAFQIPRSHCIIDEDGIGGGVVDQLPGVKGFIANSTPVVNPRTFTSDNYYNLKAQCGYKLAELINDRKMLFVTQDTKIKERLMEELGQIKAKDVDKDGKLKLISKDQVKELIGRSPDWSDNLLMRVWFELNPSVISSAPKVFYPKSKQNSTTNYNGVAKNSKMW